MNLGRKKGIAVLLTVFFSFSPVSAFASETIENPTPIKITSGLDLEEETVESTFDTNRTLYGEAEPATKITVVVSCPNTVGEWGEFYREEQEVGSLGIFSLNLPLVLGTNQITLTALREGHDEVAYEAQMKRLSQRVKKELQTMIALPGLPQKR